MPILHIQNHDKFINPLNIFFTKYFNEVEHLFAISLRDKTTILPHDFNHSLQIQGIKAYFDLIYHMYRSKKIILHSLFINPNILLILFLQPWLLKKCYWVVWGGDLYKYREPKKTLRQKGFEYVRRKLIQNMHGICTLVNGDYELVKKWYNTKGKHYKVIVINEEKNEWVNTIAESDVHQKKDGDTITLLLGNSASKANNHIDSLKILSKFKNEKIKIICPLSYGDRKYAEEIIRYGKSIFGEKFIPLTNFMPIEEYIKFLNTIDIGIFNNNRQQGLGNINSLLALGKKVYLRNDTTMYHEIKYQNNAVVFDVADIHKSITTLDQLVMMDKKDIDKNKNIYRKIYSSSYAVKLRSEILN